MPPKTHYAKGPDGHVAYQVFGDGPLDIIFVPDHPSNIEIMWEEPRLAGFLNRLGSIGRLICFDKRGTGISDPVPLGALPTLEQWMDDITLVADAAGARNLVVFGHGDGGLMSILYAATYPDRTAALVLGECFARLRGAPDYPIGLSDEAVRMRYQRVIDGWGTGLTAASSPSLGTSAATRDWRARYERLSLSPGPLQAMYRVVDIDVDLRPVLPTIRVPTLILHRAGCRYMPVEYGRFLAEHIPGAKYVELPESDYLYYAGDTDAYLGAVEEFLTGRRQMAPEDDRVLATVLFTDIVGSTARATELGDRAWRELLDRHNVLVRREISRSRGREIGTTGDGFLATFDGPARGVRCALAIQHAVREELGMILRAGLHTGECERMGDKLGGIAVHIGARVAAAAGAGEVLVSSIVKDLVAGSGLRFTDRGTHVLKGVPGAWNLFAVDAATP